MGINYNIDALQSQSVNEVYYDGDAVKLNSKIPFNGYHFNRPRVVTSTKSPSATIQEYADDLDINNIVRKHQLTGVPLPSIDTGIYGIDATVQDYVQKFQTAKDNFMTLPAHLRAQFNNDVQQFSDYLSTSSDVEITSTLKKYGLCKEDVAPAVGETKIVAEAAITETPSSGVEDTLSAS